MDKVAAGRVATGIILLLVAAALAGVVALVIVLTAPDPSTSSRTQAPVAVGWAEIAADDFINGRVLSVPRATQVLAHPSTTDMESARAIWTSAETLNILETPLERHSFVLLRENQEPTELSLLFNVSNREYPVLAAEPSIVELAPVLEAGERFDLNTLQQATRTEALNRRLAAWATALASGDSVALKNEVLDPQAAAVYRGISGLELIDVAVPTAVTREDGSAIVRGVFTFRDPVAVEALQAANQDPDALVEPSFDEEELPVVTLAYDLLVDEVSSEAPVIRAWGPPGSGAELQPFANAFVATE